MNERRETGVRSLVTVVFEDKAAVPLGHEPIYDGDKIIGHTTSAGFGYRIGKPIALAHAHGENLDGKAVSVAVTGQRYTAYLQFAPAYDPKGLRMKEAVKCHAPTA